MAVKADENGYLKYTDTKFFDSGVFQYAGCEIDPDGELGLEPNTLYNVYRPESEVTKKDFVDSLENKPLVDDHTIIGNGPGMVAPEKKGVQGVLSHIEVVDGELHGQLDIFSTTMIDKIRRGKRELSLAYGCKFIPQKGVWKGQSYDFVQSELRAGNHLAFVDEARNGHDCRVVDRAFICDSKFQLEKPDMPNWAEMSADELVEGIKGCSDEAKAKAKEFLNTPTEDELKKAEEEKAAAEAKAAEDAAKAEEEAKAKAEAEKQEAVDAALAEANEKAKEECEKACADAVEEYKAADALAKDCAAKFGTISMDGIRTQKDLAVKVCALDAAPAFLKSVKADEAIVALRGYLASASGKTNTVADSAPKAQPKTSFADYMKTISE